MRCARVSFVEMKPNTVDNNLVKARAELWPMLQPQPGLVSYQLSKIDDTHILSFSVWETRAAAENGDRIINEWVRKRMAGDVVSSKPYFAELAIDSTTTTGAQPGMHP